MTQKTEKKVKPRKIAMCGTAPSTRGLIPWDTDWEVWGQADCTHDAVNPARWFDIAPFHRIVDEFPDYHKWQQQIDFPIYMREKWKAVPTSVPFPFDEVAEAYGVEFMTATLTWMMGLACHEHEKGETVEMIGLFGYDMALDSEYAFQRPGIKHMEWICRKYMPALGLPEIKVMIPNGSDLAIPIIPYPFADDNADVAKIRARGRDIQRKKDWLSQERAKLEHELKQVNDNMLYMDGAEEDNNYHERRLVGHYNSAT